MPTFFKIVLIVLYVKKVLKEFTPKFQLVIGLYKVLQNNNTSINTTLFQVHKVHT